MSEAFMTTDPSDPLAGKSREFKVALQAVEDMPAAAAAWRAKSKSGPRKGKKAKESCNGATDPDTIHEKDRDIG